MNTLGVLFRLSLKALVTGKRLAAPVILGLLPLFLGGLLLYVRRAFGVGINPGALYRFLVPGYFHTLVILTSILFGTSAVSDDEEDGSVVYLLVRPVRRGLVYLGKLAAAAVATLASVLPSLTATFLLLAVGGGEDGPALTLLAKDLGWLALGCIAYPAAFAAVAAFARKPLQLAAGYLFLWEVPMAFAPTALRHLTISHYLLSLMPHTSPWHAIVLSFGLTTSVSGSLVGLAALVVLLLAAGSMRYERKEHLRPAA